MSMDDIDPGEFPRKRNRLDSCADGKCGGCPDCLSLQGIMDGEEMMPTDEGDDA